MIAESSTPLSDEELDELDQFLLSDAVSDEAMLLVMLDGYLTAIVGGSDLPLLASAQGGAARAPGRLDVSARGAEGGKKRSLSLRQRQEIQEMLRGGIVTALVLVDSCKKRFDQAPVTKSIGASPRSWQSKASLARVRQLDAAIVGNWTMA